MIENDHSVMEGLFVQYLEKKKLGKIRENIKTEDYKCLDYLENQSIRKRKFEPEINFVSQHFLTGYSSKRYSNATSTVH